MNPDTRYKSLIWVKMLKTPTKTLVDTGAEASGISLNMFHANPQLKHYVTDHKPATCVSVNKQTVRTVGSVVVPFHIGGKVFHHKFFVVEDLIHPVVLGLDFLKKKQFSTSTMTN